MNALRLASCIAALAALAGALTAAEKPGPNPIEIADGPQPNHLVPIHLNDDGELRTYDQMLRKILVLTNGDFGRMIFRRGGYGELSVSVNGEVDQPNEPSQSPTKFQITVVEATESIGIAINENAGSDSPLHVDVKRCDVEIDRRFAVAIQRVWATMILGTRQPKQNATIVGGYVADFSVRVGGAGTLRGMTRTPLRGLPKEFIEIGLELAGYCKLKVGECPKARKEILAHLASFERRARAAY